MTPADLAEMTAQDEIRHFAVANGWQVEFADETARLTHADGRRIILQYSRTGAVTYMSVRATPDGPGREIHLSKRRRALAEIVATGTGRYAS